jgi:hypothetical protein
MTPSERAAIARRSTSEKLSYVRISTPSAEIEAALAVTG